MRVLAADPGVTTGLAYFASPSPAPLRMWAVRGLVEAVDEAREYLDSLTLDVLVIEEFRISKSTIQKTREGSNTAIEVVGALKYLAAKACVPVVEQTSADAKAFVTDEKLRRIGWYTPGLDHARDATRHLVLYLVRTGALPPEAYIERGS